MKVSDIISNVQYLFKFQRDKLLQDLVDEGLDEALDKNLVLRTFLDEFFHKVLGVNNIVGGLEANESAELDRLIEELTK